MDYLGELLKSMPEPKGTVSDDGLLRCDRCRERTQTWLETPWGKRIAVPVPCQCVRDANKAYEEARRLEEREDRRKRCFERNRQMIQCRFADDDRRDPEISDQCVGYAANHKPGEGVILMGDIGCGKSFLAAAIANELINQGKRVLYTNFVQIERDLHASWSSDDVYAGLTRYDAVVLDDLGAERSSDYMTEVVYNTVNTLYSNGVAMIVTTNLSGRDMRDGDIDRRRIYDRLLGACKLIRMRGASRRTEQARQRMNL